MHLQQATELCEDCRVNEKCFGMIGPPTRTYEVEKPYELASTACLVMRVMKLVFIAGACYHLVLSLSMITTLFAAESVWMMAGWEFYPAITISSDPHCAPILLPSALLFS